MEVENTSASSNDRTTTGNQTSNYITTRSRRNQVASTKQASDQASTRRTRGIRHTSSQGMCTDTLTTVNEPTASQESSSNTLTAVNQTTATLEMCGEIVTSLNQPTASQQVYDLDVITTVNQQWQLCYLPFNHGFHLWTFFWWRTKPSYNGQPWELQVSDSIASHCNLSTIHEMLKLSSEN